jgi:hypothetical protein
MHQRARACGVRVEWSDPPDSGVPLRRMRASAAILTLLAVLGGFVAWGFAGRSLTVEDARVVPARRATISRVAPATRPVLPSWPPRRSAVGGHPLQRVRLTAFDVVASVPPIADPLPVSPGRAPAVEVENSPAPPLEISDIQVEASSPSSVTASWHTSEPVASRIAYGLDVRTLWTPPSTGTDHSAIVDDLVPARSHRLWVIAQSDDGRGAEQEVILTTSPSPPGPVQATTVGDVILIGGRRLLPTMVWGQCADGYAASLAVGIDVFMKNPCESLPDQVARLEGHAFILADAFEPEIAGVNVIGSFLPDEWDTFLPGNLTLADAEELVPVGALRPLFLTLTNHFYSRAAPLPQGRGDYPALAHAADVVGFDLYPLQNWCRTTAFGDVYDAQRELVSLAAGKPTFQWIEVREMDCSGTHLAVTSETVRAETWLAIAGGAHAIGYFPHSWSSAVAEEIARERQELDALAPALLERAVTATSTSSDVKVSAHERNGALYVIAVNAGATPAATTITVPELGNRAFTTLDGLQTRIATNGAFTEDLAPLEVRIYLAAPES